MSYVIQNFYDFNKKLTLTPRLKFFLILTNLEKFLIFIKINTFLYNTSKINIFHLNFFFLFFKYFFSNLYLRLLSQTELSLISNYNNNMTKSYVFYIFFNILQFFKKSSTTLINLKPVNHFLFNLYFYSIKILNVKLKNTFYRNIFFYFMLINSLMWYQHTSNIKFYLNFLFINYYFKISRFYNGHFLRIYNY